MIHTADYGRALFELARQEGMDGEIQREMTEVCAILETEPFF